jgi:AraC-like DNA-binding protein
MTDMKTRKNTWKLRFSAVPDLDLELLHAANITYDYPRHMHEEYSVVLILHGAETTNWLETSCTSLPGSLLLFNADEVHSSRSLETEYRIMKIRSRALNKIGFELTGHKLDRLCFPQLAINDPLMFQLLLRLHLKFEQNASPFEQESEFISTIGLLITRHHKNHIVLQPPGKEPQYVNLIRDYLKSHYAENVSLAQLAAITNLSPFYLLRAFSKQVGCPPHEYQTQLRITRARKLIRNGRSISEVALATGFFDQSHFSRNFKRIVGVPPGQYSSQSKIVQDTRDPG